MASPKGYNRFAETGWPAVCQTAVSDSGYLSIHPPGTGKRIHLLGVCCNADTKVRKLIWDENASPDPAPASNANQNGQVMLLFQENQSMVRFPGAVSFPKDTGVFFEVDDNVTAFYYVFDEAVD